MINDHRSTTKSRPRLCLVGAGWDTLRRTGDSSNAILQQEAAGQQEFVNSEFLPTISDRRKQRRVEKVLKTAGVKFLGVVENDALFQRVELPAGWKKVAHSHSMYSYLVDHNNRKRVEIFYKADLHDRKAYMCLTCRFGRSFDYDRYSDTNECVTNVTDGDKVIYTTKPVVAFKHTGDMYTIMDGSDAAASTWLDTHYPKWHDPGAYWD